jgi:hypothetical protein
MLTLLGFEQLPRPSRMIEPDTFFCFLEKGTRIRVLYVPLSCFQSLPAPQLWWKASKKRSKDKFPQKNPSSSRPPHGFLMSSSASIMTQSGTSKLISGQTTSGAIKSLVRYPKFIKLQKQFFTFLTLFSQG